MIFLESNFDLSFGEAEAFVEGYQQEGEEDPFKDPEGAFDNFDIGSDLGAQIVKDRGGGKDGHNGGREGAAADPSLSINGGGGAHRPGGGSRGGRVEGEENPGNSRYEGVWHGEGGVSNSSVDSGGGSGGHQYE